MQTLVRASRVDAMERRNRQHHNTMLTDGGSRQVARRRQVLRCR
jgi:hypothetical protein